MPLQLNIAEEIGKLAHVTELTVGVEAVDVVVLEAEVLTGVADTFVLEVGITTVALVEVCRTVVVTVVVKDGVVVSDAGNFVEENVT